MQITFMEYVKVQEYLESLTWEPKRAPIILDDSDFALIIVIPPLCLFPSFDFAEVLHITCVARAIVKLRVELVDTLHDDSEREVGGRDLVGGVCSN